MYSEQLSDTLIKLRLEKGITARDLSLSLGLSESYINRVESRRMQPSFSVFFDICDFFDITPAEFFSIGSDPLLQSSDDSVEILHAIRKLRSLPPQKRKHICSVIHDL